VITMSRLVSESGQITARTQDLYDYFVNPYKPGSSACGGWSRAGSVAERDRSFLDATGDATSNSSERSKCMPSCVSTPRAVR
jgi:hypothetical protein